METALQGYGGLSGLACSDELSLLFMSGQWKVPGQENHDNRGGALLEAPTRADVNKKPFGVKSTFCFARSQAAREN